MFMHKIRESLILGDAHHKACLNFTISIHTSQHNKCYFTIQFLSNNDLISQLDNNDKYLLVTKYLNANEVVSANNVLKYVMIN